MPALAKPYRVAFLAPAVTIDGPDGAYAREAALVLWAACIETCQRHPGLAVYDPESTPLYPQDGHIAPQHAAIGAAPTDAFYAPTRRQELLWLELSAPRSTAVRLHALRRDGTRESFDALGRNLGDQIQQVLSSWLSRRGLGPLPRRFEQVTADELLAVVRVVGPVLAEQARAWSAPRADEPAAGAGADDDGGAGGDDAGADRAPDDTDEQVGAARAPASLAAPLVPRLPAALRVPALRVLELALREELGEHILAIDPDHPQSRFARFRAGGPGAKDFALLRRVIAAAPNWARPYGELGGRVDVDADPLAPTDLETVAGAGIAALCRPAHYDVIDAAAQHLRDDGRVDEAVRFLERAVRLDERDPRPHLSLLALHRRTDRIGAWLAQALRTARRHGCPMDPDLPWYPDQIQVDLAAADALLHAGRLDEAIALRANRLEGREASWPRHAKILQTWRKDPKLVAWSYAREGHFRGDPARAVEGFGRIAPGDSVDLAVFLDALVAVGREDEVPLAWAELGLGRGYTAPVARLAAARGLIAAGEWRRGLEELWRVELTEPGRDDGVAIARCGRLAAGMPIEIAEGALAERMAIGAHALARRMARDVADFVPAAGKSSIVLRALGVDPATGRTKGPALHVDPATLRFAADTRGRRAIDALFAEALDTGDHADPDDALARADRLVERWLEVVFAEASEDEPAALAQAAAYTAARALAAYLVATTEPPSPRAGALRTVAAEALALVRRHHHALADRDVRALLAAIDPLLRRVDRWIGSSWLGTIERCCAIDERAAGDVAGFVRDTATVGARILGPEEVAVLSASVARLHRERHDGWESATAAQAARLAVHTGYVGVDEWADATVAQLAARAIEIDDAIDTLHTAAYLAEGVSAVPCVHAARVLLDAGRAPAALAVLGAGLGVAGADWRARKLEALAPAWAGASPGVPLAFEQVAAEMFEALQRGNPARAEKLGRWAVALDPTNAEAHRNLGLALAQQGKVADALAHLTRATREQATQILSGVLFHAGNAPAAMAVLDYASRWYTRADQWLTYGGVAYGAMDNPRTVKAYALAYQLDPGAFDASQLNAYAGVLDEVGDYEACEKIAHALRHAASPAGAGAAPDALMWQTCAQHHLACAYLGQGRFDEAVALAAQAVKDNPLPDNAAVFAATLERARTRTPAAPAAAPAPGAAREPAFARLDAGDFDGAARLLDDPSWRVRRAALAATRFRYGSENDVEVTPRARAAAGAVLAASAGRTDRDAALARATALEVREQAYFARDPAPRLGDRMTRAAFYQEFRARGGVVLGDDAPPPPAFVDRVIVEGAVVARASDYVALLRDLAALAPAEALAARGLDDATYLELAATWAGALERDPEAAAAVAAGLAAR